MNVHTRAQLTAELSRSDLGKRIPPADHQAVVDRAVPHFRVGNHEEALTKGFNDHLMTPAPTSTVRR